MKKLETTYFETYGYSFPLTGERTNKLHSITILICQPLKKKGEVKVSFILLAVRLIWTSCISNLLSSEGRKMDHLLHETDGSRRMANQIVRQVFRQPSCKQEKFIAGAKARFPHQFRFLINKQTNKQASKQRNKQTKTKLLHCFLYRLTLVLFSIEFRGHILGYWQKRFMWRQLKEIGSRVIRWTLRFLPAFVKNSFEAS